VNDDSGA